MTTSAIPVLTVPATDEAAATLVDWLIRSLVPTVLDAADMADTADELCGLAPVTCRRIARPRTLRGHERRIRNVIELTESQLRRQPPRAAADDWHFAPDGLGPIPDEIFDAAAHIGGVIADLGSTVAALANRLLLIAAALAGTEQGTQRAVELRARVLDSYCSMLAYVWRHDPGAQISLKTRR